jgi:hypothetical protein
MTWTRLPCPLPGCDKQHYFPRPASREAQASSIPVAAPELRETPERVSAVFGGHGLPSRRSRLRPPEPTGG